MRKDNFDKKLFSRKNYFDKKIVTFTMAANFSDISSLLLTCFSISAILIGVNPESFLIVLFAQIRVEKEIVEKFQFFYANFQKRVLFSRSFRVLAQN